MTLPKKERRKVIPLATDEVWAIADAVPDRYRTLVVFMAGTGLRPSETFGVTVDRVDFLGRSVTGRSVTVDRQLADVAARPPLFAPPKTEASYREVPLPDVILEALSSHIAEFGTGPEGLVFTSQSGAIDRRRFGEVWRRAAGEVRPDSTPHDCRHYYASLLINHGDDQDGSDHARPRVGEGHSRSVFASLARQRRPHEGCCRRDPRSWCVRSVSTLRRALTKLLVRCP